MPLQERKTHAYPSRVDCPGCLSEAREWRCPDCGVGAQDAEHTKGCRYRPEPPPQKRAAQRQEGGDHYKAMGVEPWDVVDTWPMEQRIGFYRGGALKYIMRMGCKDQNAQEIAKGQHYVEKLLEVLGEA